MPLLEMLQDVRALRRRTSLMGHAVPLLAIQQVRPISPDMTISISSIGKLCPREWTLACRSGADVVRQFDVESRWRTDAGTALHRMFQEEWFGPMRVLLGGWLCSACGYRHGAVAGSGPVTVRTAVLMPESCDRCGMRETRWERFRYEEIQTSDAEDGLTGHLDGVFVLPAQRARVLDIKTVGSIVPVLREPRRTDVVQVNEYMRCTGIREARILYVDRTSSGIDRGTVEHHIGFSHHMSEQYRGYIRSFRQAAKDQSRPIPACPYGGKTEFGVCGCEAFADAA
jgi:hypothetical protein